ncbi:MAG: hypothetical protein ABWY90_04115 [Solirubrobacterales bacterium]
MDGRSQLGFPLLILLALAAALALAGPGGATKPAAEAPAAAPELHPAELRRISVASLPEVADGVERVRELEFDRLPEPEVVSSGYLNRLAERQLERQDGGLGIAADNAVGRITGLLGGDEDLGAAVGSTGDLAAAAYDPRSERLFVVSDAVVSSQALVEFVLAHELDHALEDQAFGLPQGKGNKAPQRRRGSASLRSASQNDDAALASQALVEGSATTVMGLYAARYLNPLDLVAAAGTIDDGTDAVPEVLVEQLTWTYLGGQRFISELVDLAGSWKLVDNALANRPPASTEQVLHPRKYVLDERPEPVAIQSGSLQDEGWARADRNVFGEFATSLLLGVGADPAEVEPAAAGWAGDRYELWRRDVAPAECEAPCRGDLVLVGRWAWDTDADRAQFDRAAERYLVGGLGAEPAGERVWRLDSGWAAVASAGRETTLAFAPDRATAVSVAGDQAGRT